MTQEPYSLKGNDLLIYAIIYGFCQLKGQCFCGSIQYLMAWTNSTRQGVIKNLNNLVQRGLVIKVESQPTNKYYINNQLTVFDEPEDEDDTLNSVTEPLNSVTDTLNKVDNTSKQSLDNNINNNIDNNINTIAKKDRFKLNQELSLNTEKIITYLNKVCGTSFKSNTAETKKLIKQHLNEGFTLEDFFNVINCKFNDWGKSPIRFSNGKLSTEYLRPQTLFGSKFENYVYESQAKEISATGFSSVSSEIDEERSSMSF